MKTKNKINLRRHSRIALTASVTLGAVIAAVRPAIPGKVYALPNVYEWEKQENLDRLGGWFTSSAISAEGSHMIIGTSWGGEGLGLESPLFVTQNAGSTWTDVAPTVEDGVRNFWYSVDVSNNGQTMVAASEERKEIDADYYDGKIFISKNGGNSWQDISPVTIDGSDGWVDVAVSGNGNKIVAVSNNDRDTVYVSSNGGNSWQSSTVSEVDAWHSISLSDNGNKILVGGEASDDSAFVYFSDNGGTDWEDIAPEPLDDVAFAVNTDMSADGSKLVVASYGYDEGEVSAISVSENDGADWSDITPEDGGDTIGWDDIAMSDDGSVIFATDYGSQMLITVDGGTNWNEEAPGIENSDSNSWRSVDLNSDGTRAIATSSENTYIGETDLPGSGLTTANLISPESGQAIKITTPEGTTITCSSAVKESNLSVQDAGFTYPLGLVDFCFDTTEEANEVTLTFVTDLKPDQVVARKYNPTTQTYSSVSGASITETTLEGKHALQVIYTIVDNGPLDVDPDEGEIADPVGLASALSAPNTGLESHWLLKVTKKD